MTLTEFTNQIREAVIGATDYVVMDAMNRDDVQGWKDEDLPALFRALDPHIIILAQRINTISQNIDMDE